MTTLNSVYISALESRDIKRYPKEISKVPDRGSVTAADAEGGFSFPEVAGATAESLNLSPTQTPLPKDKPDRPFRLWEKEQFGFGDFLDIINPLQHLPIVATIYRNMTGDKIGFAPRVIGGAVWGRAGGFVSGVVNAIVDWLTGKDVGDYIYGALFGTPDDSGTDITLAQSPKPRSQSSGVRAASLVREQAKSSFGPFNDDGGFALGAEASKEIVATEQEPFVAPLAAAALNSYAQNIDLGESQEPFRFRFPA